MTQSQPSLLRALTLRDAIALVVGTVVGTGVFLKTAVMTQQLGSPTLVLLAWLAAGLLSLAGALAYAELGAMFPQAGGDYVYLREAFGRVPAFFWGWTQFAVVSAGAAAAVSTGFAIFLSALVPLGGPWIQRTFHVFGQQVQWQFGLTQIVAVSAIAVLSGMNCLGAVTGGRLQGVLTVAKIAGIGIIVLGVFFFTHDASWAHLRTPPGTPQWSGTRAFGAAMMGSLWAYTGWYVLPVMAGEVQNPQRNVPRGLILGTLIVLLAYLLANFSYFYALPLHEIASANSTSHPDALSVGAKAAQSFFGQIGAGFVSLIFVIATLGTLNGIIMSLSRIPYAMARDDLFFRSLGELGAKHRAPVRAIVVQAIWASMLALSGTFDQITTYVTFALWLFYGVTVTGVFVLRRRLPNANRPYRTLGYPVLPLIFIVLAFWLVVNTIITSPAETAIGLAVIALGFPLFVYFRQRTA